MNTPITFDALRAMGFRLQEPFGNYQPHMRLRVSNQLDTYLEIGTCGIRSDEWTGWIVCEIGGRYGKFCFLRSMTSMEQVGELYTGLTGKPLQAEAYDTKQFVIALEAVTRRCEEHWKGFWTNEKMRQHILWPQ